MTCGGGCEIPVSLGRLIESVECGVAVFAHKKVDEVSRL